MTHQMPLPKDHLDRLFGRDMQYSAWQIDVPAPANDDAMISAMDAAILSSLLKRSKR
jgi:hypothetical protein|tara:strand:+ start:813 stop:983 length:171 start_codon:yes stop_codon:yes gene_type:complete